MSRRATSITVDAPTVRSSCQEYNIAMRYSATAHLFLVVLVGSVSAVDGNFYHLLGGRYFWISHTEGEERLVWVRVKNADGQLDPVAWFRCWPDSLLVHDVTLERHLRHLAPAVWTTACDNDGLSNLDALILSGDLVLKREKLHGAVQRVREEVKRPVTTSEVDRVSHQLLARRLHPAIHAASSSFLDLPESDFVTLLNPATGHLDDSDAIPMASALTNRLIKALVMGRTWAAWSAITSAPFFDLAESLARAKNGDVLAVRVGPEGNDAVVYEIDSGLSSSSLENYLEVQAVKGCFSSLVNSVVDGLEYLGLISRAQAFESLPNER